MNREKINERQRELRRKNGNAWTKKYEKTPKGFLMRTYRNMLSRVTGVQSKKSHLYLGKEILNKEDFYNWALKNDTFLMLFKNWTEKNYDRKLTPSIDRIDPKKGYTLSNIRWLTHSENSRRATRNYSLTSV